MTFYVFRYLHKMKDLDFLNKVHVILCFIQLLTLFIYMCSQQFVFLILLNLRIFPQIVSREY